MRGYESWRKRFTEEERLGALRIANGTVPVCVDEVVGLEDACGWRLWRVLERDVGSMGWSRGGLEGGGRDEWFLLLLTWKFGNCIVEVVRKVGSGVFSLVFLWTAVSDQ